MHAPLDLNDQELHLPSHELRDKAICATQNPSELSEGFRNNLQIKYVFGLSGQEQTDALWGDHAEAEGICPDLSPSRLRSEVS